MFKITLKTVPPAEEEEIIVKCHAVSDEVLSVLEKLKSDEALMLGTLDGEVFRLPVKEIFYAESVDNKTYLYARQNVYETKLKLYEIEERFRATKLFRCSKSMIVNIAKIRSVAPSVNGRLEAKLQNGEIVLISRQYVAAFKQKIGM